MTEADLKAMKLHEEKQFGDNDWVMRVPNGWRYTTITDSGNISTTFVPEIIPILQYAVPMP